MPSIIETTASATGRESIILDPSEVSENRVELDITGFIRKEGPDWGDAEISAAVAEMQRGEVPVDFRIPNRKITIPLLMLDRTSMTFTEFRAAIQQKVGLFQRRGGWIKRDAPAGALYADIVSASLKLGGSAMQSMHGVDVDAVLTLEVLPDWYEDEIDLTPDFGGNGDVIGVLLEDGDTAVIRGDSPARCRIKVENLDATNRDVILWGFRSQYYDDAATTALVYEGEDLGASATLAGASGGNVTYSDVGTGAWGVGQTWEFTHVGSYRIWARVHSTDADVSLQALWRTSNGLWTTNPTWSFEAASTFEVADLGTVRIDRPPVGTHEWDLQIRAYGDGGASTFAIDKIWLQPLDEGAGELRDTGSALIENGHTELRTEGMYRERTVGSDIYAPISHVLGDLPRLPPSGLEQQPVELFLTIFEPDADLSAQVYYRPSWLFAPGG